MPWYAIVGLGAAGAAVAVFLGVLVLPVRVSLRFETREGRNTIRVWIGPFGGLAWIPVFRRDPGPEPSQGDSGVSAPVDGLKRLLGLVGSIRAMGEGILGTGAFGRGRTRAQLAGGRAARAVLLGGKSTGLDVLELSIHVELGSGEAASSAIGVGIAYALIGGALAAFPVPLRFPTNRPDIVVVPRYDGPGLAASVRCIVALAPGYIILRGIQAGRSTRARTRVRARVGAGGRGGREDGQ